MNNNNKISKFNIIVGIINVTMLVGLVACLVAFKVSNGVDGKEISVNSIAYTQDEVDNAMAQAENEMTNIYSILIGGTSGDIGEYHMSFGTDGSFDGFYDNDNCNISGYTYEILKALDDDGSDVVANVNIYNSDSTSYVQYKLKFDENSNLMLYYPGSDLFVELQ
jgi:hypothetical protein